MRAIVLAAGYATRLRPLTEGFPKPLLPVGGRPMLDWLADRIDAVAEVEELHVVTNSRYAPHFTRWAGGREGRLAPVVHDDGTSTNEDRLGAIGDIRFTIEQAALHGEDLLVIAGDNLFDFELSELVAWWRTKEQPASALALHDVGDLELARQYGIVEVDASERVVAFLEKPERPPGTLAATAAYLYHREHAALVDRYLGEGNPPDQPGRLDIGDREQLLEADNRLRRRRGLPERAEYAVD